jgi:hypothetical protein
MLVYVRPSNEALLRERVPGARGGLIGSAFSLPSQRRGSSRLFTARIERQLSI